MYNIYIYVYIYICIYCTYIILYIYIRKCIYVYKNINIYVFIYIYICKFNGGSASNSPRLAIQPRGIRHTATRMPGGYDPGRYDLMTWLCLSRLKLTPRFPTQSSSHTLRNPTSMRNDVNHCESNEGGTCLSLATRRIFQNHKARASLAQSVGVNFCRFVGSFEFTWFCNHIHFSLDDLSLAADMTVTANG